EHLVPLLRRLRPDVHLVDVGSDLQGRRRTHELLAHDPPAPRRNFERRGRRGGGGGRGASGGGAGRGGGGGGGGPPGAPRGGGAAGAGGGGGGRGGGGRGGAAGGAAAPLNGAGGGGAPANEPIIGDPIGRDGLMADLVKEMIPYTPEELIALAEREYQFSLSEM